MTVTETCRNLFGFKLDQSRESFNDRSLSDSGLTDNLLESKRLMAVLMFTLWVRSLRARPDGGARIGQTVAARSRP